MALLWYNTLRQPKKYRGQRQTNDGSHQLVGTPYLHQQPGSTIVTEQSQFRCLIIMVIWHVIHIKQQQPQQQQRCCSDEESSGKRNQAAQPNQNRNIQHTVVIRLDYSIDDSTLLGFPYRLTVPSKYKTINNNNNDRKRKQHPNAQDINR
jgi:hypothetical protein